MQTPALTSPKNAFTSKLTSILLDFMVFWTAEYCISDSVRNTSHCQNHGFFLCCKCVIKFRVKPFFAKLINVLSYEYDGISV